MKRIIFIILTGLFLGCSTDEPTTLTPPSQRIDEATAGLISELTAPPNGWMLNYQPINDGGTYLILLNFNEDGTVLIKSDVSSSERDFFEDEIPYRIDARNSLELILETYSVFHFLFDQRAATFEAEFEFLYVDKVGNDLLFTSKSDFTLPPTVLGFTPATANAESMFSREVSSNLSEFEKISPQFLGGLPSQQIILEDDNVSVFWTIDFLERIVNVDVAAEGKTIAEILTNDNKVSIGHSTNYQITDDKIVLAESFSFVLNATSYTIGEIALNEFGLTGEILCVTGSDKSPVYTGEINGLGSCTIKKTLYDDVGTKFQPMTDQPYSVNVLFIIDKNGASLSQMGSIADFFPTATGFAFNYGFEDPDGEPPYGVGLYVPNEEGISQVFMREFEMTTTTDGNIIQVNLTDNYYFSSTPGPNDQANLEAITDEIFANGRVYASGIDIEGLDVFRLYNPCNGYEVYLVQ